MPPEASDEDDDDEFDDVPTQLHRDLKPKRPLEPAVGVTVSGKYRLESLIAKGGMGTVWRAVDERLERPVAVKFMDPSIAADAVLRERFAREAKAAARLRTPHVVQIYDYGIEDLLPFMVLELLEGEDLHARLKRQAPLPLGEAAWIIAEIAKGLRTAHEAGVVHRDLKPQNVYLAHQGADVVVKILDFGVAKLRSGNFQGFRTEVGTVLGSPNYMSPEQARGRSEIDHRADLWSLAVIAFRAVTGKMAFPGEVAGAVLIKICADPIPVPSRVRPGLPPQIDAFFVRAMQRDPNERFQTAGDLADSFCNAVLEAGEGPLVAAAPYYKNPDSARAAAGAAPATQGISQSGAIGVAGRTAATPPPVSTRLGTPQPTPHGGFGATQATPHSGPASSHATPPPVTTPGTPSGMASATSHTPHSPVSSVRAQSPEQGGDSRPELGTGQSRGGTPRPQPAPAAWPEPKLDQATDDTGLTEQKLVISRALERELPLLVNEISNEMTLDTRAAPARPNELDAPAPSDDLPPQAPAPEPAPAPPRAAVPTYADPAPAAPAPGPGSPGPGTDEVPIELPMKKRSPLATIGGLIAGVLVLAAVGTVIVRGGPKPNPGLSAISTTVDDVGATSAPTAGVDAGAALAPPSAAASETPTAAPTDAPETPTATPSASSSATPEEAEADAGAKAKKKKGGTKPKQPDWGY